MHLTLFDLDHTLIPFDSTAAWLRFLVGRGEVESAFAERYLACCRQYVEGTIDVADLQRAALAPLAGRLRAEVLALRAEFVDKEAAGEVPDAARELVRRHEQAGDLCCIVTNTSDVVAEAFSRVLGVADLLATRATVVDGRFSGDFEGEPCYGPGKIRHVLAWLAARGLAWRDLAHSRFYSDSITDLPLMSYVHEAIAIAPDTRLREHAVREGWRIFESLAEL